MNCGITIYYNVHIIYGVEHDSRISYLGICEHS